MLIKNAWYVAAWAHEVGQAPFARRICNEPVVLFRDLTANKVAAIEDRCCHRGAPLQFGKVIDRGLQCGYHGLVFNGEGQCVEIPGQENIPAKARIRSYPVYEKDEIIWIWMGDPALAKAEEIFDYPYHNDHVNWPHRHEIYHVKSNYTLLVDNLMDLTHLAYVHVGSIGGDPKQTHDAKMTVTRTDTGLRFQRWMPGCTPPPTYTKAVPGLANRVDRWQEFEFFAPGVVIQWTGATDENTGAFDANPQREGGVSMRIFHGLTPETDTTCHYFWSTANGYRQDDPSATEQLFDEIARAFMDDKRVVEAQQERLMELSSRPLVDITSDAARVHMRRTLERMAKEERLV